MVLMLPSSKILLATLMGSLMAVTIIRGLPRPKEGNKFGLRRHHYKFEDENSISDEAPFGASRRPLVIVDPLKDLLAREFDDGSRPRTALRAAENDAYFSRGLWDSDLPRPNCPDGDDEHIYQVRRVYPCRVDYESYR